MDFYAALSVLGLLFMVVGSALTLCAAVGLLRFNDVHMRMHPAAKPQVIGLIVVLIGTVLRLHDGGDTGLLLLAAVFAIITSPVVANRVANVAYRESAHVNADPEADPLEDA